MYFGHKQAETEASSCEEFAIYLKYHMPLRLVN